MKNILYYSFIGFVQGITEFLPVSSSGHIALLKNLFGIKTENLFFETSLHLGTFFSLLIFFRKEIFSLLNETFSEIKEKRKDKKNLNFILLVLVGIIPAGFAGFFLDDIVSKIFTDTLLIGIFYILLSIILFSTKFSKNKGKDLNIFDSLVIGIFQVLSLLPGISRSGTTISTALHLGIEPKKASDFSFFMAMPIILGSFLKELFDVKLHFDFTILYGVLVSFLTGYLALVLLYKILKSKKFYLFSIYTFILGIILIVWKIKPFF